MRVKLDELCTQCRVKHVHSQCYRRIHAQGRCRYYTPGLIPLTHSERPTSGCRQPTKSRDVSAKSVALDALCGQRRTPSSAVRPCAVRSIVCERIGAEFSPIRSSGAAGVAQEQVDAVSGRVCYRVHPAGQWRPRRSQAKDVNHVTQELL